MENRCIELTEKRTSIAYSQENKSDPKSVILYKVEGKGIWWEMCFSWNLRRKKD